jgi:SPP1 gp7 family putative phage head morphogenesis protein
MADKYWQNRANESDKLRKNLEDKSVKKFQNVIDLLESQIESEINSLYRKYAEVSKNNDDLNLNQFAQSLMKGQDLANWRKSATKILSDLRSNGYQLNKSQKMLAKRLRITHEEGLLENIKNMATLTAVKEQANLKEILTEIYNFERDYDNFSLSQANGMAIKLDDVNKSQVESAINQNYLDKNYSDRVWDNRDALVNDVSVIVKRNVLLGAPINTLSSELSKKFDTKRSNSERLIRTESAIAASNADQIMYSDVGVDEFEFVAMEDERTCPTCGYFDGKTFPVSDGISGINMPPLHANCRCTTIPAVDLSDYDATRLAKNSNGNYIKVPKSWTYEDWKKNLNN